MANFLVYIILDEKLTYDKVPQALKEELKNILIELGYEELIK